MPYRVALAGEDKFFIGSDFPHGEGFVNPIVNTCEAEIYYLADATMRVHGVQTDHRHSLEYVREQEKADQEGRF